MRRRKAEASSHERWLVSYADLITLLFALFVVLYAMSRADLAKFKQVAEGMQKAFGPSPGSPPHPGAAADAPSTDPLAGSAAKGGEGALSALREALEESIALAATPTGGAGPDVRVAQDARGVVVSFRAEGFWKAAQVDIHEDVLPLVDRIGRVVANALATQGAGKLAARIEGHTDATEDAQNANERARDGWELSSARAAWLARYWMRKFALDPTRLSVGGYSHFRPLPQSTTTGLESAKPLPLSKNRRLEVVISLQKQ
jgi:chemotaxis protein MotB